MYHVYLCIKSALIVRVMHAEPDNSDDTDHSEKERLGDDYTAEDSE